MFEQYKAAKSFLRIAKQLGIDIENPSKIDQIVLTIIAFPLTPDSKGKRSVSIFKNKYILCDAALFSMCFALHYWDTITNKEFIDLQNKIGKGIVLIYGIMSKEYISFWPNRPKLFDQWLKNLDSKTIILEMANLFTYDLTYNKFVDFNESSPYLLSDVQEKFIIETETMAYYKAIIPLILKNLETKKVISSVDFDGKRNGLPLSKSSSENSKKIHHLSRHRDFFSNTDILVFACDDETTIKSTDEAWALKDYKELTIKIHELEEEAARRRTENSKEKLKKENADNILITNNNNHLTIIENRIEAHTHKKYEMEDKEPLKSFLIREEDKINAKIADMIYQ